MSSDQHTQFFKRFDGYMFEAQFFACCEYLTLEELYQAFASRFRAESLRPEPLSGQAPEPVNHRHAGAAESLSDQVTPWKSIGYPEHDTNLFWVYDAELDGVLVTRFYSIGAAGKPTWRGLDDNEAVTAVTHYAPIVEPQKPNSNAAHSKLSAQVTKEPCRACNGQSDTCEETCRLPDDITDLQLASTRKQLAIAVDALTAIAELADPNEQLTKTKGVARNALDDIRIAHGPNDGDPHICPPMFLTWPKRMWVNQPSALQLEHALHGETVLVMPYTEHSYQVHFLNNKPGGVSSRRMLKVCLSPGWRFDATYTCNGNCRIDGACQLHGREDG